jgi:hypothetical protein
MASSFFIAGPTVVRVAIGSSATFADLGYSDNDNLPSVQLTDNHHEVKTVLSGNVPEEIVLTGTSARITLALVKWDQVVLETILSQQRGATSNSTVGRIVQVGVNTFRVKIIVAAAGGTTAYLFNTCYLQPDGMGDSQWGNRERVLTLNISAIPDSSNDIYTYTT